MTRKRIFSSHGSFEESGFRFVREISLRREVTGDQLSMSNIADTV